MTRFVLATVAASTLASAASASFTVSSRLPPSAMMTSFTSGTARSRRNVSGSSDASFSVGMTMEMQEVASFTRAV